MCPTATTTTACCSTTRTIRASSATSCAAARSASSSTTPTRIASPTTGSRDARSAIHFTAGSERNEITENAFVDNRHQVMYVGTRFLDWSVNGRGNYYSDNPAFDLKGTGDRRHCLPAQRSHGSGHMARAGRQDSAEQPGRAGRALGAGAVSGDPSGRRDRLGPADDAASSARLGEARAMTGDVVAMRGVSRTLPAPIRRARGRSDA